METLLPFLIFNLYLIEYFHLYPRLAPIVILLVRNPSTFSGKYLPTYGWGFFPETFLRAWSINESGFPLENEYLTIDFLVLSFASSCLYVWGDGELSRTGFFCSSSFALGFTILTARVRFFILSNAIGSLCDGVSNPLNWASSVVPPIGDF